MATQIVKESRTLSMFEFLHVMENNDVREAVRGFRSFVAETYSVQGHGLLSDVGLGAHIHLHITGINGREPQIPRERTIRVPADAKVVLRNRKDGQLAKVEITWGNKNTSERLRGRVSLFP